jgi:hypothetical protein
VYTCAYCGRPAPPVDDAAILDWEGGGSLHRSVEARQLPPESLVCPDCSLEECEREEGGGD